MGPVGQGPWPPKFRGFEWLTCIFLLGHHKQNGANSNGGWDWVWNQYSDFHIIHSKPRREVKGASFIHRFFPVAVIRRPQQFAAIIWHMCSFKLKMYQHRFWPRLCPGPRWGAYNASPDPLIGWGGDTSAHSHPLSTPLASREGLVGPGPTKVL